MSQDMLQPDEMAELPRELAEMPAEELNRQAEALGLEASDAPSPRHLALELFHRKQAIGGMNREALVEAVRWTRKPVAGDADNERMAQEIVRCKSMRFDGLSLEGLKIIATLRNVTRVEERNQEELVKKLKKQEGFFTKFARKRRKWMGAVVSSMLGEKLPDDEGNWSPNTEKPVEPGKTIAPKGTLVQDIEEAGLLGGLAGRIKREADEYLNQKLDEISNRIDQKLDDIDKRLSEWRDKEVANRLRIIKITLWASILVAGISLVYGFVKVYILPAFH